MSPRITRIVMPETAKAGSIVRVRCTIQHPMITGHSSAGANTSTRQIVNAFVVTYAGGEVFRAEYGPGIAANPYVSFAFRAETTGDVVFTWSEDGGARTMATRRLTVAPG